MNSKKIVPNDIRILHCWLKENNYHYASSNCLPKWKFTNLFMRYKYFGILWRQFNKFSPLNLRNFKDLQLGKWNPQATILMARSYLNLWSQYKENEFKRSFFILMNRIIDLRSPNSEHFTIKQNKILNVMGYSANENSISPLLTAMAGELFYDAHFIFPEQGFLPLAKSIINYFIYEHPKLETKNTIYFKYTASSKSIVYNASAYISSFLCKFGKSMNDYRCLEIGKKGIYFILISQNENGSWFYGKSFKTKYIDGFHTALVLSSIYKYNFYQKDNISLGTLKTGLTFYLNELFDEVERDKVKPIRYFKTYTPFNSNIFIDSDLRDIAHAMILFCQLDDLFELRSLSKKIFNWTKSNMENSDNSGTYYPYITKLWNVKIPYIEYQAWMFLALSCYYSRNIHKCDI